MSSANGEVEVVVSGHLCLDIIPTFKEKLNPKDIFIPGRLTEVGGIQLATGGAVSNTGQALHKLGVRTRLMGKVGNDELGKIIVDLIRNENELLSEGIIISENEQTSYTIVLNVPNSDRIFLHNPGTNDTFLYEDIKFNHLEDAKIFHFGYPPIMKSIFENDGKELVAIFKEVKSRGVATSLDMAMPDPQGNSGLVNWEKFLENVLPYVDMFFPSIEEILFMLNRKEYERITSAGDSIPNSIDPELVQELGELLLGLGTKLIGIKVGGSGFYLRTGTFEQEDSFSNLSTISKWQNRELWIPCFKVNVKGTTGAGDSTIAGFIAGICEENEPETTLQYAVGVGAFCVEETSSTSGIPTILELKKRIAGKWEKHTLAQSLERWEYSDEYGLWVGPNDGI
ncbi:carbohydrate kinase family protein [Bacillus sp. JJ1566]|uniref:carbohydrate kinase family protein n=1 Tax=Bacillus sp. JJ1566 TaxID=3122961 RepID=UPI002FFDEB79